MVGGGKLHLFGSGWRPLACAWEYSNELFNVIPLYYTSFIKSNRQQNTEL